MCKMYNEKYLLKPNSMVSFKRYIRNCFSKKYSLNWLITLGYDLLLDY